MTDQAPTDEDQMIACYMLAAAGLSANDIARHLRVHPQQVHRWLRSARHSERNGDDE